MESVEEKCGATDDRPQCVVCGFPDSVVKLIRLTWEGEYDVLGDEPRMVVARAPKVNDVLLCTGCIRGVKRLPFSDIAAAIGTEV